MVDVYINDDGTILQQSERLYTPIQTGEGFIYQRNNPNEERLKVKITGNFGNDYISRFKYNPPSTIQTFSGEKYPALIFDNYYNNIFGTGQTNVCINWE